MTLLDALRKSEVVVEESLKSCAPIVERVGLGAWNFVLNNGSALRVGARADDRWLRLDAPVNAGQHRIQGAWQLLRLNSALGGLSKVVTVAGYPGLRLRAEIPLDEDADLRERVKQACAGLKAAAGQLHGESHALEKEHFGPVGATKGEATDASGLRSLCEASGWKFTERTSSKLAVDLETRNGFYQAIVENEPSGRVSLTVEVASQLAFCEISKRAIGALLLRASGLIRMARASVKQEQTATASFETLFETAPNAAELSHALSALAIASGLCGRTVEAMRDEVVARNYLASQGIESK
ncbi:MAG: hypothetical protein QOJ64_4167 [Acidobacteriota bacterium]|jgi:hypothetical protein|nr:hypothetical protein [Acidobacteriota bacterium]